MIKAFQLIFNGKMQILLTRSSKTCKFFYNKWDFTYTKFLLVYIH